MSSEVKQENCNDNYTCERPVSSDIPSQNVQQITGLSGVQKPVDCQDRDGELRAEENTEYKPSEIVPVDKMYNEQLGNMVTKSKTAHEDCSSSPLTEENKETSLDTGIKENQSAEPTSQTKNENNMNRSCNTSETNPETALNKEENSCNFDRTKDVNTISESCTSNSKIEICIQNNPSILEPEDLPVLDQNNEARNHILQNPVVDSSVCNNEDPKVMEVIPEDAIQISNVNQAVGTSLANNDQSVKQNWPKTDIKKDDSPPLHHVKCVQFKDKKTSIITQNENGPCPLVAIMNVLLLRHQVVLPSNSEIIPASKLLEYIGNEILESVPKYLTGASQLNYEQNMQDAVAILPKLQTGLDVNVKYTGVQDFEYTPECIIFDLLGIPLYHAWLVDPQQVEVVSAIGQAGYNQLVEKVLNKTSNDPMVVNEALIIENFLENTASQMTYHGLSELASTMKNEEIAVLFRNNHFSTIYKHKSELFQLVTDQGFLGEPNVVWETLSNIDGDGEFVDSYFKIVPPRSESVPSSTAVKLTTMQQIDQDYLVALSLQEEQPGLADESLVNLPMTEEDLTAQEHRDADLARQLQRQEEQELAAREAERARESGNSQSSSSTATQSGNREQKEKNCTIL